ncbi:MAG: FtsW/RodA/SpoVE family cell cycle protein [Chloroflexota bacterium]
MINNQGSASEKKSNPILMGIDVPLAAIVFILILFGLLMVYSASWDFSFRNEGSDTSIFLRQLLWLGIGIGAMLGVTFLIDYHRWEKWSIWLMIGTIGLLMFLFFIGKPFLGSTRALINQSGRPSELAKYATIIYLAVWLIARREVLNSWILGLSPLIIMLGFLGALIYVQPDLSAAITLVTLGILMFALAGSSLQRILVLVIGMFLVGMLFVSFSTTGNRRMNEYSLGIVEPTKASDHVQLALGSFIQGGWFGVGIGNSATKLTGLPIPHTDSIFAVVGEETGVIGTTLLIAAYIFLLWRCLIISANAPDMLGRLIAGGLGFWIVMEALINMGGLTGTLPFAGNVLPFVSYGGTNLIITLVAVGTILNISRQSTQKQKERTQPFNAVVDLRGRHGRRRIPRPVYPTNHEG